MSVNQMVKVVDLILDKGDEKAASDIIITETIEQEIVRKLGEVTYLNYLMKFEEYLDNHSIYLFDGWSEAIIPCTPQVDKFWVVIYLIVPENTDFRGSIRIVNDKEGQNRIARGKLKNGKWVVRFKLLKRYLDEIEQENKERASDISDREIGKR